MKQKKILVVDDDEIIRKNIEKEVKRNFFDTFQACDGKAAMEIFTREDIDIVLLDVKLPDVDGLEFLKEIKKKKPECEVIVITGFGTQEVAVQALRRGAIDYLEKPIQLDVLNAALGRAQEKLSEKESLPGKNTLLVIDDEEQALKPLVRFLGKEGFEVFSATSGKEGLSIIEKNKIDVFITDINLGDITGIDVLKSAKSLYDDIEGIMMTGNKEEALAIESLRAGAIDYLNKPVNLDELLISIQKAINNITLNRNILYRDRERKITTEIISKMNEELEKRIEERSRELNQTQAQLFQTSKLATLGEMSTGLAHEMNQPLGGIALIVTNIKKMVEKGKLTNEDLLDGIKDIELSIKRMTKTIHHIRTFARQDTLKFIEVEINMTIDSTLNLLSEQLRLHSIAVELNLGDNLPKMSGEPYQLEQVWINLVSNARDALDSKEKLIEEGKLQINNFQKKLTISTSCDKDSQSMRISFLDNGLGMSEEQRQKALEPFFTTKEVGKGSGLGLSISYGIIERHNGQIEIESEKDQYTRVTVILPLHHKEEDEDGGNK